MLKDRINLYKEIENQRKSKLIVYVTSDRKGLETQIASDVIPIFTEHLDKIGDTKKISLYLYTRGGETLAAWSLVNLIRNFCNEFEVIIQFNCHSAGTLICLGANKIIMTKQATLGPIDPSINGPLNPMIPGINNPNARVPISVEFVNAYLEMAKRDLGINNQIGLANILINLSNQIHPLTLGQVNKSKSQIQMLAKKLLANQGLGEVKEDEIIKFLCSESGSHDYTIHRKEATESLGLQIENPSTEFYKVIKAVYDNIQNEMELLSPYDPKILVVNKQSHSYSFRRALIESIDYGCNVFISEGTLVKQSIQVPQPIPTTQTIIQDNRTLEGWKYEKA
jgi:ClpP class serine protease